MWNLIGPAFKSVAKIIDDTTTSGEERLTLRNKLFELQSELAEKVVAYEKTLFQERSETIRAEVASQSWLARSWRPLVMLIFTSLVAAHWFGWTAPNLTEVEVVKLLDIIQLGLGGYVIGRSAEKIIPKVAESFLQRARK